jgi:hypothetical protein
MVNETDEEWALHQQESRRMIDETDHVIVGGNKFLGIESMVDSMKGCSTNLDKLIDGPKYKTLSDRQRRDQGIKFIDDALDSIFRCDKFDTDEIGNSDIVHLFRQIRNKFENENSNENTYTLLSNSSSEIDELGSLVSEYRNLDVYDYV